MPKPEIHTTNTPETGLPPDEMAKRNEDARKKRSVQWPLEKEAPSPNDEGPVEIDINPPKRSGDSNTWEF